MPKKGKGKAKRRGNDAPGEPPGHQDLSSQSSEAIPHEVTSKGVQPQQGSQELPSRSPEAIPQGVSGEGVQPQQEKPYSGPSGQQQQRQGKGRGKGRGGYVSQGEPSSQALHHQPAEVSKPSEPRSKKVSSAQETQAGAQGKGAQKDILEKMAGLSFQSESRERKKERFIMAKRPDYGRSGKPIALLVNYFKINFKDISVYHYDVDIVEIGKDKKKGKSLISEGRTLKQDLDKDVKHVEHQQKKNMGKAKCREIISEMIKTKALKQYCPVYDGQKNIFTNKPFPFGDSVSIYVPITFEGREKVFCVNIKAVKKEDNTNVISLEPLREVYRGRSADIPQEILLVFDTIMCHREPPLTQVQARNSFFPLSQAGTKPLDCGLEIWFGFNQSVRLTKQGPVVILNVAAKAFHSAGPVISYASDVLGRDITKLPKLERWQIESIAKALRGIRVRVTHQRHPRKYKVKGLSQLAARELIFEVERNKKISIVQYFREHYNLSLKYPNLPCLHMQTGNNNTYIPMETCEVVEGQPKVGKLSGDLTAKMIRQTAIPPRDRFDIILDDAHKIDRMCGKTMRDFGFIMDVSLTQVNGRIITAPKLAYSGNEPACIAVPDDRGVWRIEGGKKFYKVNKINKWILMSFASEQFCGMDKLKRFSDCLVGSSRKCGMAFGPPTAIKVFDRRTKTEEAIKFAKQSGAEFAVIVLSRRDNVHSYEEVKFLADFKYNLVTQCMEDKNLARINDQITTNVCLKINVKLGGINHILFQRPQIFSQPVIVFGADAIHWPRDYGYPSIASVVGSLNPTASRYALACRLQKNEKESKMSQEIIREMGNIVKGILETFKQQTGVNPHRIVFFRDGVSEGQFEAALEWEVSGIQKACHELYNVVLPITYIVVQKRHQTRFRPRDPRDGKGKMGNVPPGTVVDKEIIHPVFFDYFVCSHEGIQGTSKPAHYTVLHDDNKFTSDDLQQLSYFLCHNYARCTRSVSLPAPVLYADLAAARAKKYADLFVDLDTASSIGSECSNRDLPPHVVKAIESMKSFENNMFYI